MQFIDFEQLSSQIITHADGALNLRYLNLYDSHIIELLPTFGRLRQNTCIDLSSNHITDFGAVLLISQLKTAGELILEKNNLSENFLNELSKNVWTHNLRISINGPGENETKTIQLSDYSKRSDSNFTMLNQHFTDHIEAIYQNPDMLKSAMLSFLLRCVKYWRNDYIHEQSYQQIVARKLLPGEYSTNKQQANIFNVLVTAVNYAAEVERLISIYKCFIKNGEAKAENLLLKEVCNLITTIDDCELIDHEYYDSYDFICDIFDYFVKRYNDEIDNSLFYGTSPPWQDFIKNLRSFFSDHIVVNRFSDNPEKESDIAVWQKVKSRSIFTLHRDKCSRLLAYFSGYLGGRTQTLIQIDNSIAELRSGGLPRVNPLQASIENSRNIKQNKLLFFKAQPAAAYTQLLSAIRLHDRPRVAQLLNNSNLIDEVDTDFWSPIHHWAATSLLDREILTLLIAAKPTIIHDIITTTGWNAVFVIINNCGGDYNVKVQKLELLIQYGIDYCLSDYLAGKLPIHYAVMSDEERLIEVLYKLKPETLQITDNNNKTPSDYANPGSVAETLLSYYDAPTGDKLNAEWRVIL